MSCAGVTVALLPLLEAHWAAASCTALVSASPEDAIMILRSAGPALCWVVVDPLSSKPLPHALVATSDPASAAASAAWRSLVMGDLQGSGRLAEHQGGREQDGGGNGRRTAVEKFGEQIHAAGGGLGQRL